MSPKKTAPELKLFTFNFYLNTNPKTKKEWKFEEGLAYAKAMGFKAIAIWDSNLVGPIHAAGLETMSYIDANDKTYKLSLCRAKTMQPSRVNVQLWDHDTPPKVAVETWIKMAELAPHLDLNIDLEVHRDTCTETPEKTYEIAELYKQKTGKDIMMCFDFSHIALVKHLNPPYAERLLTHPRLIQKARQLHFRSFNGHHCQVPILDGKGNLTIEAQQYIEFVDELLKCWLRGAKGGETLYVNPEQLPGPGYGLSTFNDIWMDVLALKDEILRLWAKNIKLWQAGKL
ncbi:MAG: xylose isomerase [Verrucomicrobiota bacterium]|nr:xylose isomerase [Verrucomicrobiota bacterium]